MHIKSNISRFKEELDRLVNEGDLLWCSLGIDTKKLDKAIEKEFPNGKLPSFKETYEIWYSQSMQVVKQILPDRLDDFVRQYRDDKRKEIDYLTYGVYDYLIGIRRAYGDQVIADETAAFPKFEQQLNILKSAQQRFESVLFNIIEIVQADLFDNELDAATELCKKGFTRGAGAIAGVVLEKHLAHVCETHSIKQPKKHPTINDLNQTLKDSDVIDVPTWRFIQHLGDLRNLCDHNKDQEPSKEESAKLIAGVSEISKTVF
jgi:hypothetical protein